MEFTRITTSHSPKHFDNTVLMKIFMLLLSSSSTEDPFRSFCSFTAHRSKGTAVVPSLQLIIWGTVQRLYLKMKFDRCSLTNAIWSSQIFVWFKDSRSVIFLKSFPSITGFCRICLHVFEIKIRPALYLPIFWWIDLQV